MCYCGLIVNVGSRDERESEYGMAHFIEHTIFKGTAKRRAFHILNRIDEVGGELNAYTTKEETVVHATFLKRDFDRAAELISDMVFNSTFPERELAKEKEVILDEISSYNDTPSELIFDDFDDVVFNKEFGHNVLGDSERLATFDGTMVRDFMRRNYNTDQMVLSVLGSMTWKEVVRIAEKYYGCIAQNKRQWTREKPVGRERTRQRIVKNTSQGHVVMGGIAPNAFDKKRLPMYMLNNMIGGPCMNSRLNIILRERNGIAYNVETEYNPYYDTGLFSLYFGTDAENLERSIRIVNKELARICMKPLTEIQLKKLKRQMSGQLMLSADNGEDQMLSIGRSVLLYGQADDIETSCKNIETVSAKELLDVANEVVHPERLSILIYS